MRNTLVLFVLAALVLLPGAAAHPLHDNCGPHEDRALGIHEDLDHGSIGWSGDIPCAILYGYPDPEMLLDQLEL